MVVADMGLDQGGGLCLGLGTDILRGGAVGPAIQIQDMGDEATHQEGIGQISPQGEPQDDVEATYER